jgi:transposase
VLRDIRPAPLPAFEVRFETPPGDQAQVDFAQFQLQFTDEPTITRIVWLFSFVLGFSRLDLGALRPPPGHADGSTLSHGSL